MTRPTPFAPRRALLLAALASASCGRWSARQGPPMDTGLVNRAFVSQVSGKPREYALWVPPEYNESARKWPAILFLHGYGESGDDINLALKHGPIKEAMTRAKSSAPGKGPAGKTLPFIIISPQSPKVDSARAAFGWVDNEPDAMKALEDARAHYRIDPDRIYLTGLSMGGFGAFYLAQEHPNLFAAVAPVCGGGEIAKAKDCAATPFWIFHGQKDGVVPSSRSVEMAEALKSLGADVKLTLYPDLAHDSWTVTYANDELYAWFLKRSLRSNPKPKPMLRESEDDK